MNKRGLSHIEVILGFVIFMIAIFFLLASYEPLFKSKPNEVELVQKLYDGFLENTSVEVKEYYVFLDINYNEVMINLSENISGYGIIAEDEDGSAYEIKNVSLDKGNFCLTQTQGKRAMTIRLIKNLSMSYLPLDNCLWDEKKYNISTSYVRKMPSIDNIEKFGEVYNSNPGLLKTSFDLPMNSNFEYVISFEGKSYKGENTYNINGENVYATSRKISAFNKSGHISDLEVNFKIW